MPDHVFAYGSLAAEAGGLPAVLRGFRRVWGVAMDNSRTIPGYKCYLAPDGSRPEVCVAFLDIVAAGGAAAVDGVVLTLAEPGLALLDARERNYRRVDVTSAVDVHAPAASRAAVCGRVWAYVGREDSRSRLRDARATGRAVIDRAYARSVARWAATTEPSGLPEADLRRVDLPPVARPRAG